ncbi:MAG: amino acid ABC transporter permease [Actinomycetota bacterium]
MSGSNQRSTSSQEADSEPAGPEPIKAVPLRRPGRTFSAAAVLLFLGLFLYGAATNPAYEWPTYAEYLFDSRIINAAGITIMLTVLAMALGLVLGVMLAAMRLSPNPVLRSVSWGVLWFFRGTPVYVQLVFWGLIATIYHQIDIGIPFGPTFATFDMRAFLDHTFWIAVIGLALNEAAYMAEIVRAGITSVDEGQTEAATALGMSWTQTMAQIVMPQAMRVIIPPAGNELISMLKTTSLVIAVPYTLDLYARARDLSIETFNPIPMLMIASTWYLAFTSILMVGQMHLERYFAKGASRVMTERQLEALAEASTMVKGDR